MVCLGVAAACGRGDRSAAAGDAALDRDLQLAAQAQPYRPVDSVSAAERGYASAPAARPARATTAPRRTAPRAPTTYESSSAGDVATGTAPAPERTEVVKHTKRDALIGAAAGATIGAVTSSDKVKGALIGAAAGGIVGGVIGNNVDKKTRKVP
jgi:hypothetical protein